MGISTPGSATASHLSAPAPRRRRRSQAPCCGSMWSVSAGRHPGTTFPGTTPSRATPAAGPPATGSSARKFSRGASATRSDGASTPRRLVCGWLTWVSFPTRKSTRSAAAETTAGRVARACRATTRPGTAGRTSSIRSRCMTTARETRRSSAASSTAAACSPDCAATICSPTSFRAASLHSMTTARVDLPRASLRTPA